jgi:hypothetical protein
MTPAERLRQHQRSLQKAQRELEREKSKLEAQEKKTMADIKKNAKAGNMVSAAGRADAVVRVTQDGIEHIHEARSLVMDPSGRRHMTSR